MTLKQWVEVDHLAHPKPGMPSQALEPDVQPDPHDVEAMASLAGSLPGGVALLLQEFKLANSDQ